MIRFHQRHSTNVQHEVYKILREHPSLFKSNSEYKVIAQLAKQRSSFQVHHSQNSSKALITHLQTFRV